MKIPEKALQYIQMHRTDIKGGDIAKQYIEQIEKDFEELKPWLPEKCKAFADIGCGVAGIDVLISRHYNGAKPYLIDGSGVGNKKFHFYEEGADIYNDIMVTKEVMQVNNVPNYQLTYQGYALPLPVDFFISILSWGFHYPIDQYLKLVTTSLKSKNRLILDIRCDTNGKQCLEKDFEFVGIVSTRKYSERCVFERK